MSSELMTFFVDGSGVELSIVFDEKRVEMEAFDEKTHQRYRLTFADCTAIRVAYADLSDSDADLYNLTDGVTELDRLTGTVRRFRVGFVDESEIEIHCKDFTMVPVPGGRYDSLTKRFSSAT